MTYRQCFCAIGGDSSVSVTGNGSSTNPYSVRVKRSATSDNQIQLLGDGLYVASTTSASGGYIVCTSSTRPAAVAGRTIYETDTNRTLTYHNSAWRGQGATSKPANQFFDLATGSVTSATLVSVQTNAGILTAPYDLRMVIRVAGWCGFATIDNGTNLELRTIAGAAISPSAGSRVYIENRAAKYSGFAMLGYIDFAAGAACGYQLMYNVVGGGNNYIRAGTEVEFIPRSS